jgi:hypothetical protein
VLQIDLDRVGTCRHSGHFDRDSNSSTDGNTDLSVAKDHGWGIGCACFGIFDSAGEYKPDGEY